MGELQNVLELYEKSFFFDMDGVVAKWETDADPHEKGFFLTRKCEQKAKELIRSLKDTGFSVTILSAVYNNEAEQEKVQWLNKNELGDIPHLFVPFGSNKSAAVKRKASNRKLVLIDDYTQNLRQWDEAGHTAVKFLNGVNNTHGTWMTENGTAISLDMTVEEMKDTLLNIVSD